MNFVALNLASEKNSKLIIILNDNEMAIDKTVGSFKFLTTGNNWKDKSKKFFNGLNFNYIPVANGHNIKKIISALNNAKKTEKVSIIHLKTEKGKGLPFAKTHKFKMHFSVPFDPKTGEGANPTIKGKTMSMVAAQKLNDILKKNKKTVIVTPATPYASHLEEVKNKFKNRIIDVGMAEQHAVGYTCGLALNGLKPILCIQSTFLQRAYDQLIHDLSYMKCDVLILASRSGFAGFDSPTHHGVFDLSYLNTVPNLNIYYPSSIKSLENTIDKIAYKKNNGPSLILMPYDPLEDNLTFDNMSILKSKDKERNLIIFCLLNTLGIANKIKNSNQIKNFKKIKIFCIEKIKPFETNIIKKVFDYNENSNFISIEENILDGGLGSIIKNKIDIGCKKFLNFGIENKFIEPGNKHECQKLAQIDSHSIILKLNKWKKN